MQKNREKIVFVFFSICISRILFNDLSSTLHRKIYFIVSMCHHICGVLFQRQKKLLKNADVR